MSDDQEANKALVRRLFEEGFNRGNLDLVDELVAADAVTHNPLILDATTGPGSIRNRMRCCGGRSPISASRCWT